MLIRKHPRRHTEGCPCTQVIFKTCKASLLLWLLFLLQCRFVLSWSNFNATDIPKLYFVDSDCVFVSSKCLIPCYIGPRNSETWRYNYFGFYLCKLSKYFEDVAWSMNGLHQLYFPEISASAFGLVQPASLSRAINSLRWHDRRASYAKNGDKVPRYHAQNTIFCPWCVGFTYHHEGCERITPSKYKEIPVLL